jgi:hypothetical protein
MVKATHETGPAGSGNMLASMEVGREETLHAWKRTCTLYSKYFSDLAKADNPGDLMQANAELMAATMETFGKNAAGFLNLNSASQAHKH